MQLEMGVRHLSMEPFIQVSVKPANTSLLSCSASIACIDHIFCHFKVLIPPFYIEPAPDAVGIQVEFLSTVEIKVKLLFLVSNVSRPGSMHDM